MAIQTKACYFLFLISELKLLKVHLYKKHFNTDTKASIKTLLTLSKCTLVVVKEELNLQFYLIFIWISYTRCVEHEVLLKYPNTCLKYSYHIKSESSNQEQRSIHNISGNDRLRMLLYVYDILLFCEDIHEQNDILSIYDSNV